ncbi:unnamed protein product [Acanthosepion pharaonis]|uniref:Uncharacterized protein n=1 Tax=Acanthosepion pharaonis TaxID=158019 RepID=A0A812ATQ8_ACAPH|nr:unnamed protein product [Sepia pharaonis]
MYSDPGHGSYQVGDRVWAKAPMSRCTTRFNMGRVTKMISTEYRATLRICSRATVSARPRKIPMKHLRAEQKVCCLTRKVQSASIHPKRTDAHYKQNTPQTIHPKREQIPLLAFKPKEKYVKKSGSSHINPSITSRPSHQKNPRERREVPIDTSLSLSLSLSLYLSISFLFLSLFLSLSLSLSIYLSIYLFSLSLSLSLSIYLSISFLFLSLSLYLSIYLSLFSFSLSLSLSLSLSTLVITNN